VPLRVDDQTLHEIGSNGRAYLAPVTPKLTEQTEHSAANSDGGRDCGVRSDTEHPSEQCTNAPPDLALDGDIIERTTDSCGSSGWSVSATSLGSRCLCTSPGCSTSRPAS